MESMDFKRKESLKELVLDSIPQNIRSALTRIALMQNGDKQICVITLASPLALQKWKQAESKILENMRNLYRQRDLKSLLAFHQVIAEVSIPKIELEKSIVIPRYKERSSGTFEIYCQDEELRKRFASIQAIIKQSLNKPRQGV